MLNRVIKAFAFLLIILFFSVSSFILGYHYYLFGRQPLFYSDKVTLPPLINEAITKIKSTYYGDVGNDKLINGAMEGMVEALDDPYAQYLDAKHFKDFSGHMSGGYSGVGMLIEKKKNEVYIVNIFEKSPAEKAGLKKGDKVKKIDGKSTAKMPIEQAAKSIQGKAGTRVRLVIERNGKIINYSIQRARIDFPNVSSRMKGRTIGYLRLHSFTQDVGEKLAKEITKLERKGAKKIIFDLRGNPGGHLSEAVSVTSLFLEDGVVLKTVDRQREVRAYNTTGDVEFKGPLVILVDDGSASASEIVAGALKEHKRATVVGLKTFGKGSVQEIVPLSNGGAIIIPSQKWLTPQGHSITGKGIKPNVSIKDPDRQLEKALEILGK